jgi:hypothetical protein
MFGYFCYLTLEDQPNIQIFIPYLLPAIVASFAALQTYFNSEKIRLDLYKPRYESLINCLHYCQLICYADTNAPFSEDLKNDLSRTASLSFRKDGLISALMLFDRDILKLYKKIGQHSDIIESHNSAPPPHTQYTDIEYMHSVNEMRKIIPQLRSKFNRYWI